MGSAYCKPGGLIFHIRTYVTSGFPCGLGAAYVRTYTLCMSDEYTYVRAYLIHSCVSFGGQRVELPQHLC